jgi:hypothetical protein
MRRRHRQDELKPAGALLFPCDLCGSKVPMGAHSYRGRTLPHYDMFVCHICYDSNWDGIGPVYEKRFERHLAQHGIPLPTRNRQGWYPR